MTDTAEATPHNSYHADVIAQYANVMSASTNIDGWTGERQRRFLEFIADGDTVRAACKGVKLSTASAYAFRRRAKGRAFDLGWKAADLIAREKVAGDLLARAMDGQEVTVTRADGTIVTRHHYDNRLALTMLARLDRYADTSERTDPGHAARTIATDFDSYLDLIGAEGGPAHAGLFMLAHGADWANTSASELEPIVALARADRAIRCGTLAPDVAAADLDPARRADWTAEQWARAELAGLLVLAPPPAPAPERTASECQPLSTPPGPEPEDEPVWWEDHANDGEGGWRTHFPPPELFLGQEFGEYGDDYYTRELDEDELALVDAIEDPELEARRAEEAEERDRWFAALRKPDQPPGAPPHERVAKPDAMPKAGYPHGDTLTADGEAGATDDEQDEGEYEGEDEEEYEPHVLEMIAKADAMLRARSRDAERPAALPVEPAPLSGQGNSHGLQEA